MSAIQRVLVNDQPWESVADSSNLPPFSKQSIDFVTELSSVLLRNPKSKQFPETVALGFWLRSANINRIIQAFLERKQANTYHLARGLTFHIAPSNVDTIFVYSWIISLLCGNRSIIRISSRPSRQMQTILNCIDAVLERPHHSSIAKRLSIVRYEASDETTGLISQRTDVRVIWGGDQTVLSIRKLPLPPTSIDLSFANKWSLTVIDVDHWNGLDDSQKSDAARRFALDSFQFGQAACSSPRCVVWLNKHSSPTNTQFFWDSVYDHLDGLFEFSPVDFVNKLVEADVLAAQRVTHRNTTRDNRVTRLQIEPGKLKDMIHLDHPCDAGFFLECMVQNLDIVFPQFDRKVQSVASLGVQREVWESQLEQGTIQGIDRIVPLGKALDFDITWDGFDLLSSFLRLVTLQIDE
jgi:hypothetical protein